MCFLCMLDSLDKFYKKFYLLFFAFGKTGKIKLLKVNIKMYDAFIHLVHILKLIQVLGRNYNSPWRRNPFWTPREYRTVREGLTEPALDTRALNKLKPCAESHMLAYFLWKHLVRNLEPECFLLNGLKICLYLFSNICLTLKTYG